MPTKVAVYCSSGQKVARAYFDAAEELGRGIAKQSWTLVYGGNDLGCMGALARAARSAGGRVIGITPKKFVDDGYGDHACDSLLVTETMRERKALMESHADAFVALPGGLGTLEELFEIIVGRSLGYHAKPIVLLNIDGFYDPLLALIEHGIERHFIRPKARGLMHISTAVSDAMDYLTQQLTTIQKET